MINYMSIKLSFKSAMISPFVVVLTLEESSDRTILLILFPLLKAFITKHVLLRKLYAFDLYGIIEVCLNSLVGLLANLL